MAILLLIQTTFDGMDDFKLKYLDFYKWLYESELKRKDELDKVLTFPVTVLSIYAGATYFVTKQYLENRQGIPPWFDWLFIGFGAIFVLSFLATAIFLIGVFWGFNLKTKHIPYATELNKFRDGLIGYYERKRDLADDAVKPGKEDTTEVELTKDFNLEILNYYADCSTQNAITNDRRSDLFYHAKTSIVISSIAFVFISLVGLSNVFRMNSNNSNTSTQTTKPEPAQIVRPQPPQPREVRELPNPGTIRTK